MTENTFGIKSVHVFFVLTICLEVTISNIVIYRGTEHPQEYRDLFVVPKASCQQVQYAQCSMEELMKCHCRCNWYYYKEPNKCVESKDIHKKEGKTS